MKLARYSLNSMRGWVDPGLELPDGLCVKEWEPSIFSQSELLLDCRGRRIFRTGLKLNGEEVSCFVYFFRNSSFGRSLRSTYSIHIMRMAEALGRNQINSLDVLAALKPNREVLNWSSLLIAREIDSVRELPSMGNHVFQIHEVTPFSVELATALAGVLAHFHQKRFAHGDLKTRHLLTRQETNGSTDLEIFIVDLEKTQYLRHAPAFIRDLYGARDLVQLLCSLPEVFDGESLVEQRRLLIDRYFSERRISQRRKDRIRRVLRLYEPGGPLKQGRTVVQSLLSKRPTSTKRHHRRPESPSRPPLEIPRLTRCTHQLA